MKDNVENNPILHVSSVFRGCNDHFQEKLAFFNDSTRFLKTMMPTPIFSYSKLFVGANSHQTP